MNQEIIQFQILRSAFYMQHNIIRSCHVAVEKSVELIKRNYWFPNMKKSIREYIDNCLTCISFSHTNSC